MPLSKEADRRRWHRRKKTTVRLRSGKKVYNQKRKRGVCSRCGKRGVTQMHHRTYAGGDSNLVEMCRSCHNEARTRQRKLSRSGGDQHK